MADPIVDSVPTDVVCPGRDCDQTLLKVTRLAAGVKEYEDWVCPVDDQHVTQQWAAPADYRTF